MSRYSVVSLAALVVAGLIGVSAIPAVAGSTASVLRLVGHQTSATQLDLGPPGGSPGDEVVFSGDLLDTRQQQVGHFEGVLVALDAQGDHNQATVTLALPNGQIAVQGELFFSAPEPFVHAVTGGTGRYADAGGTFSFRRTAQPGFIDITLDLRL